MQGKNGVAAVIGPFKKHFQPQSLHLFLQVCEFRLDFCRKAFVLFFFGHFDQGLDIIPLGVEPPQPFQLVFENLHPLGDLVGIVYIIPEVCGRHLVFQLFQLRLQLLGLHLGIGLAQGLTELPQLHLVCIQYYHIKTPF